MWLTTSRRNHLRWTEFKLNSESIAPVLWTGAFLLWHWVREMFSISKKGFYQ